MIDDVEHELAIRKVLAVYCQLLDDGDFAGVTGWFTADGRLVVGTRSYEGADAMVRFFEKAQAPHLRGKHITANPVIERTGDGAEVRSDFVFYRFEADALTPMATGRYSDQFVLVAEGWRIASRTIEQLQPFAASPR